MSEFFSKNFPFLVVKFSVYLNRRVFVMGLSVQEKKRKKSFNREAIVAILDYNRNDFSFF